MKYLYHYVLTLVCSVIVLFVLNITYLIPIIKSQVPNVNSIKIQGVNVLINGEKSSFNLLEQPPNGKILLPYAIIGLIAFGIWGLLLKTDFKDMVSKIKNISMPLIIKYLPFYVGILLLSFFADHYFLEKKEVLVPPQNLFFLFIASAILIPILEELLFRHSLYEFFKQKINIDFVTLLAPTIAFAVIHMQYSVLEKFVVVAIGFLLTYIRHKENSLGVPMLFHIINNTVGVGIAALG